MLLHAFTIGFGHDQDGRFPIGRANGSKHIGRFKLLLSNNSGTTPFGRPNARQRPSLTDAGFILKPDFNRR
jgi:hypothetical protein